MLSVIGVAGVAWLLGVLALTATRGVFVVRVVVVSAVRIRLALRSRFES